MGWIIYHNPRCSKSRAALALLREAGVEPKVVEYLKTPPSVGELDRLLETLGAEPASVVRFDEAEAKTLGLRKDDVRPRREWLGLLHRHPVLLQRPIVVRGQRAVLGRPPEAVRELLDR